MLTCVEDKAYWEVKVQQGGIWSIGLATPSADMNRDLGLDHCSWALTSTGLLRTRGQQVWYPEKFLSVNRIRITGCQPHPPPLYA